MSIKMIKCGFCCEQFEYEKLISNYQYGGESHICINCNDYINKMTNLKKPKLEDVLKSIKNDKTDYSYLFK